MPTEKEAAQMWCPFVRRSGPDGTWNRGTGSDPVNPRAAFPGQDAACNCLGSRCMAWRWSVKTPVDSPIGYCGLAGQGYHP